MKYKIGDLVILNEVLNDPLFCNRVGKIIGYMTYYKVVVIGGFKDIDEDYIWNVKENEIRCLAKQNLICFI